jgi:ATPase complex subunit ATP10
VVACFSGVWAEHQTESFVSLKTNPQLHIILEQSRGKAQLVSINMEDNTLKAWLVRLFMPRLRQQIEEARHKLYFLVRKGLDSETREPLAMVNSRVGYIYLLDGDCKIRWAGSGQAEEGEVDGLAKGLKRLLKDAQSVGSRKWSISDGPPMSSAKSLTLTTKSDYKLSKGVLKASS